MSEIKEGVYIKIENLEMEIESMKKRLKNMDNLDNLEKRISNIEMQINRRRNPFMPKR